MPKPKVETEGKAEKKTEASVIIDKQIARLADWRGETIASVRRAIHEADPQVVEELKWLGTPTWTHGGIICVAAPFKDKVKVTFIHGASLPDPKKLFVGGLAGKDWRAIDLHKGDRIDEYAFKDLVRAAVKLNTVGKKER